MTTQKQIDSAIKRTFKRLEKISCRKDKLGYNPYQGIYYHNSYFYVTDSICMVKANYRPVIVDSADNNTYYKVDMIEKPDRAIPIFNVLQDDKTKGMTYDHNSKGIQLFDRFFYMGKPSDEIAVDPRRLEELLIIFSINKLIPTITQDVSRIRLFATNDFCSMEAVLMGVRK